MNYETQKFCQSCAMPMGENHPGMTEEKARQMMEHFLPTLKRWRD